MYIHIPETGHKAWSSEHLGPTSIPNQLSLASFCEGSLRLFKVKLLYLPPELCGRFISVWEAYISAIWWETAQIE